MFYTTEYGVTYLLVESELLLIAVTMVKLLALLPGDAGTWRAMKK